MFQKVHPMANILGTLKDMEQYKQQYQRQIAPDVSYSHNPADFWEGNVEL